VAARAVELKKPLDDRDLRHAHARRLLVGPPRSWYRGLGQRPATSGHRDAHGHRGGRLARRPVWHSTSSFPPEQRRGQRPRGCLPHERRLRRHLKAGPSPACSCAAGWSTARVTGRPSLRRCLRTAALASTGWSASGSPAEPVHFRPLTSRLNSATDPEPVAFLD
jgi:hypothetical protein